MGFLRFILAITVVIAHSSPIFGFTFVGGQIAVQSFYMISGFYMTLILNEKYVGTNSSYKLFISNRFLRLYPIYGMVLLLTIVSSVIVSIYTNGNNLGKFGIYAEYYDVMSFGSLFFLVFTNLLLFL
jgi:peptidoglycan/LPS O-acetylase OafA/YrhL